MKTIKIIASIALAGAALQQMALAQTNADAAANPPMMVVDSNQPVALRDIPETNSTTTVTDTMGAATAPATNEMATTVTNAMEPATNETAAANEMSAATTNAMTATNQTTAAGADTNATPGMPPIVFQDVPLTTAIEALAREANINYLMDPKVGFGQPDEHGQIKVEPNVSVRWEDVTYQQALLALLDNYGLQMIVNPKTQINKITTKDPTAPPPLVTRVIQLKYASTSNMAPAIVSAFTDRRSHVLPDNRTSQLVVVATDGEQAAVDTLVNQLDKPTRQVLIETKIIELSSNPSTQKGIDWSGTLAAQNVSIGNDSLPGTPPTPTIPGVGGTATVLGTPGTIGGILGSPGLLGSLNKGSFFQPSTLFLNADGVKAVLSFLNSSSDAQVVSMPRIVTLDNETATIDVTRSFPIFNTEAGTQGSPGGSSITYSNVGTVLEVTPRISANDYIWLKVIPTVSSFFGVEQKTINGVVFQADQFDSRSIDTQVLIPNSHTLVLGGLVKDNPNAQYTKVPFLGDIPIIGLAFRHEDKSMEKDNLLLFITPTIVKDSDFKPASPTFLDSQPRQMPDPMNPKTMYDGAQPRGDWSNPLSTTVQ